MQKVRIYIYIQSLNKEIEVYISDNYVLDKAIKDIYRLLNEDKIDNIKVYYEDLNSSLDTTKSIKDIGLNDGDRLIMV